MGNGVERVSGSREDEDDIEVDEYQPHLFVSYTFLTEV
jgi:hypothetical protein